MKIQDLRKKDTEELQKLLNEKREQIRDLRFKQVSRQIKDVRVLRKTKREVARIITIVNENRNQLAENRKQLKKTEMRDQ